MLLCDVGNTSFHFLDGENDYKEDVTSFEPQSIKEKIYYICVNPSLKTLLEGLSNWIDLSKNINKTNYYNTMGIDRIVACESIRNGIIIDAGSAITVDVVIDGIFTGGFIYPGISAMSKTYESISPALKYPFNFDLNLNKLPKNSQDAISYGYLKTLYSEIISYNMQIYITGGDARTLEKIFPNSKLDELLLFKAMKKLVKL